jgi:hypothetical protein
MTATADSLKRVQPISGYRIEEGQAPSEPLPARVCDSGLNLGLIRNHDDELISVYATRAEAERALAESNGPLTAGEPREAWGKAKPDRPEGGQQ